MLLGVKALGASIPSLEPAPCFGTFQNGMCSTLIDGRCNVIQMEMRQRSRQSFTLGALWIVPA